MIAIVPAKKRRPSGLVSAMNVAQVEIWRTKRRYPVSDPVPRYTHQMTRKLNRDVSNPELSQVRKVRLATTPNSTRIRINVRCL
jgi:hypothetical protein